MLYGNGKIKLPCFASKRISVNITGSGKIEQFYENSLSMASNAVDELKLFSLNMID
jgi:hypothetical protein